MEFSSTDPVTGRLSDEGMFSDLDQADSPATQRRLLKGLRKQGLSDDAIRATWPQLAPLLAPPLT